MKKETENTNEVTKEMLNMFRSIIPGCMVVEVHYLQRDKLTGDFGFWISAGFHYIPSEKVIATLKKKGNWAIGERRCCRMCKEICIKTSSTVD
ncbi:hypothetical protein [Enterococcus wangshanyuanii]|uniref:hypothetical protein n=1 Tax=Enterococcus wangshanyuanii TaxID=2005703 RepID=UPI0012FFB1F1|nr:hypothetical protein [Enterococcus wangshanyuanii]